MALPHHTTADAERMTAYLDEELDAAEAEAFESFLAESPEVREELDDLRRIVSLVAALPPVEAPEDFYEQLSRRIRRRQLLSPDSLRLTLVSLPFQVLSIVVILAVAALYMMAELEETPRTVERDPDATSAPTGEPTGD
jgi:anti-sigma factor RsiW